MSPLRTRWAALGAAVAVTLGAGGIGLVSATNPAGALTFIPITPCRVIDTRPAPDNVGPKTSPLGPGETHTVTVHGTNGDCTGIPTTAKAVSLNVTAVGATQPTFLTLWATGQSRPLASSLNPTPGQPPTPNAVTTDVDTNGRFNIYNLQGNVHVLADINGYYAGHNHDDRYYTEAEVDAALAENGPLAYGMSRADGSLRVQSSNVVEVLHPGVGMYCVVFDPPVSNSRLEAAVISGAGSGPVIGENTNGQGGADSCTDAPNGTGLELRIYNDAGGFSDERFTFVVP
jgi:hypothetical protein